MMGMVKCLLVVVVRVRLHKKKVHVGSNPPTNHWDPMGHRQQKRLRLSFGEGRVDHRAHTRVLEKRNNGLVWDPGVPKTCSILRDATLRRRALRAALVLVV